MGTQDDGLHAEHIQSAVTGDAAAQSRSLHPGGVRCVSTGLKPDEGTPPNMLTDQELREAREELGSLIEIRSKSHSTGFIRRWVVRETFASCWRTRMVFLSTAGAMRAMMPPFARRDFGREQSGSEECEGTNGIGTALAEQRALTIHRDQHFRSRNTALSCTVAPIFDHRGRLMAAIDVSSARSDLTEGFVKLIAMAVVDAARRVEAENFRLAFPKARIVMAQGSERGHDRALNALIAVDEDDLVVGASRSARALLGLTDESLNSPLPAANLLGQDTDAERGFADSRTQRDPASSAKSRWQCFHCREHDERRRATLPVGKLNGLA